MEWDLGVEGIAVLLLLSVGFGLFVFVASGRPARAGLWPLASAVIFATGLITSEVWFGWATEEELQPNIDGLSFDEVLLSSFLTTVVLVAVVRRLVARGRGPGVPRGA